MAQYNNVGYKGNSASSLITSPFRNLGLAALVATTLAAPVPASAADIETLQTRDVPLEEAIKFIGNNPVETFRTEQRDDFPQTFYIDLKDNLPFDAHSSNMDRTDAKTSAEIQELLRKYSNWARFPKEMTEISKDGNVIGYISPGLWDATLYSTGIRIFPVGSDASGGDDPTGSSQGGSQGGGGGGPGGGPGLCLLNGSEVMINENETVEIQNLKVGDEIASFDEETGKISATKITMTIKEHPREAYFKINDSLKITNDHPVLVSRNNALEWVRVDKLEVGDKIKSTEGFTLVETIEKVNEPATTVYLETESGNFLAKTGNSFVVVSGKYKPEDYKELEQDKIEVLAAM